MEKIKKIKSVYHGLFHDQTAWLIFVNGHMFKAVKLSKNTPAWVQLLGRKENSYKYVVFDDNEIMVAGLHSLKEIDTDFFYNQIRDIYKDRGMDI